MVYITPDEFKNSPFGGFDLREKLSNMENESFSAESFIELVTMHLQAWIDVKTFRDFKWEQLTPHQLYWWKLALIAQAQYTYREGAKAFGLFSGADDEKGKIFDPAFLDSVEVCKACIEFLTKGGLFNLNIKNRRRIWPSGSNYGFF